MSKSKTSGPIKAFCPSSGRTLGLYTGRIGPAIDSTSALVHNNNALAAIKNPHE